MIFPTYFDSYRSVFINSVLVLWTFQLSLDSTRPLDDMGLINGIPNDRPYPIDFKTRITEMGLGDMMRNYPEVVRA